MPIYTSKKSSQFAESVIREMTRVFLARGDKPGVNLAQGFPDFAAPDEMKEAACAAIRGDINQYAITWGSKRLRGAISEHTHRFYGVRPDPDREITVTCGATEAMMAAMLALVDPGDEVIVFEPFYENYGPDTILAGAIPRFVRLNPPNWEFEKDQLAAAFNNRTRAIIINTPNNPTGKVFSISELEFIAELCRRWNVTAIMDEIYEHMVYVGKHHRMVDIEGMRDRTVTISGASKTFSATGWRVGWLIAPTEATDAIRKVHDFLTVGAAAPLQEGVAHALGLPDSYYSNLAERYREKRDSLLAVLRAVGFNAHSPEGAYYILTDAHSVMDTAERLHKVSFTTPNRTRDSEFAHWMVNEIGVAAVPGSSFYGDHEQGSSQVRFCYCKKPETLELAERLLLKLKG